MSVHSGHPFSLCPKKGAEYNIPVETKTCTTTVNQTSTTSTTTIPLKKAIVYSHHQMSKSAQSRWLSKFKYR